MKYRELLSTHSVKRKELEGKQKMERIKIKERHQMLLSEMEKRHHIERSELNEYLEKERNEYRIMAHNNKNTDINSKKIKRSQQSNKISYLTNVKSSIEILNKDFHTENESLLTDMSDSRYLKSEVNIQHLSSNSTPVSIVSNESNSANNIFDNHVLYLDNYNRDCLNFCNNHSNNSSDNSPQINNENIPSYIENLDISIDLTGLFD